MNSVLEKRYIWSKLAVIVIAVASLFVFNSTKKWRTGVIEWDVVSYYAYLPATFIYNDLRLDFIEKDPEYFKYRIWPTYTPEGYKVIKTTMGLSYLYCPFFLMAHATALLFDISSDGYSWIYSFFLLLSNIFYVSIGFIILRKILLRYFDDWVVSLTLLSVYFGTNLYFYTLMNAMSHGYIFFLVSVFLWTVIEWHKDITIKNSLLVGIVGGLIILVRPINILLFFVWIFYGVSNAKSLQEKVLLFWKKRTSVLLIGASVLLMFLPQVLYWKYVTDHWLFWSYIGESFFWAKPHVIEGLFGFRKGWFIYTPIMFPATIGLFFLYRYKKELGVAIPVFWMVFTYVIFCWWSWWYGGGLSIRAYIDIYPFMAMGLATAIQLSVKLKNIVAKSMLLMSMLFLCLYGGLINYQYIHAVIHYDGMNYEAWKYSLFRTDPDKIWDYVKSPDYEKARSTGEE